MYPGSVVGHTCHGFLAVLQIADVTVEEAEGGPLRGADQGLHFVLVALVATVGATFLHE